MKKIFLLLALLTNGGFAALKAGQPSLAELQAPPPQAAKAGCAAAEPYGQEKAERAADQEVWFVGCGGIY